MTTHEARPSSERKSFASVAAAAAAPRSQPHMANRESNVGPKPHPHMSKSPQNIIPPERIPSTQMQNAIHVSMSKLDMKDIPVTSKALDEHAKSSIKRAGLRVDDDNTLVSNSTNTNSFDGKSTASGTTFAFDEKESLRPDDSASVQAVDDDDIGSGPFSRAPSSRIGSEAGGRAFRDQFNEVSANIPPGPNRLLSSHLSLPPNVVDDDAVNQQAQVQSNAPTHIQQAQDLGSSRPPMSFVDAQPDEKLFEALDSPKDRLFLLKLEKIIIDFIQNTTELKIQLPPCNSFCRLLAHKLADYYGLTHFYDGTQNAVDLFRTPFCRLRTPISELPRNESHDLIVSPTAPVPAMKIMRRPDLNKEGHAQSSAAGTTESSVVASKAGSEVGEDNPQGTGATSPTESAVATIGGLSRAQREARYKLKREQLFGPQNENGDGNESVNEISRVSSRSEKKSAKKKTRPNNDDFEGRSEYFPTMSYPQHPYPQAHQPPGYFVPYAYQAPMHPSMAVNGYHSGVQDQSFAPPMYSPIANQGYPPTDMQGHVPVGFGNHLGYTSYDQQPTTQYIAVFQQPAFPTQSYPTVPSPSMDGNFYGQADTHTPKNAYSLPFQPQEHQGQHVYQPQLGFHANHVPHPHSTMNGHGMNGTPSPYPRAPASFNPQTRSFVPNGAVPMNSGHQSMGATIHLSNGNLNKPNTNGSQLPQNPLLQSTPFTNSKENSRGNFVRKHTSHANGASSPSTSSLAKWAAPATLPAKPPPPEAPIMPESLPVNNQFNHKPQPMTTGQPMPQFHNGVYSMPGGRQHG